MTSQNPIQAGTTPPESPVERPAPRPDVWPRSRTRRPAGSTMPGPSPDRASSPTATVLRTTIRPDTLPPGTSRTRGMSGRAWPPRLPGFPLPEAGTGPLTRSGGGSNGSSPTSEHGNPRSPPQTPRRHPPGRHHGNTRNHIHPQHPMNKRQGWDPGPRPPSTGLSSQPVR